ncbi:MAG: hypothetical protein WCD79_20825, partial [Chthoniobacteraceae bacterium]
MFEKRATTRSLNKLARQRGKALRVKIRHNPRPVILRLFQAAIRLIFPFGAGVICVTSPTNIAYTLIGMLGLGGLLLRWNRVAMDSAPPPAFLSLYPISAEHIWAIRFRIYLLSSLWNVVDAVALISLFGALKLISLHAAWAAVPGALAYAAWMTMIPPALALVFPSLNPKRLFTLVSVAGGLFAFTAKEMPVALIAGVTKWAALLAWWVPAGWFYHFLRAGIPQWYGLLLGTLALVAGTLPIRFLAAALERKMIRREEDADTSDERATLVGAVEEEGGYEEEVANQPPTTPRGEARAQLEEEDWGTFPGPETFLEKFFWRRLNERQRTVAKLMWPHG